MIGREEQYVLGVRPFRTLHLLIRTLVLCSELEVIGV